MPYRTTIIGLAVLLAGVAASASPWWEDFPRMVDSTSVSTVSNHHGSFAMTGNGNDPAWGTFFQADQIRLRSGNIAAFQAAGLKQIYYTETYGQSVALVAELGAWNETDPTPVLHHFWNWQNYGGGTIRWLGAKNFFDNEDFARPYTRTHPRYGGIAMAYPDGTEAAGYAGADTDPRNSRVYDAACAKDLLGALSIDYAYPAAGSPTNGLVDGAGHMSLGKDAACPLWTNYTHASTLLAADAGVDGMWTDNYGPWDSLGYQPVKHAFGDWSVARFRTHLDNNFNWLDLIGLGVTNLATFDIREHLKTVATGWGWDGSNLDSTVWGDPRWMDDDLWRAYLVFKRQTGTEALANYYSTVKSAALEGGKPEFLVAGNDIPGFSLGWCRGDLDMVSTEMAMGWQLSNGTLGFKPPPVGRYAPFYKLAREHAQSRFVNVWLYTDGYETELAHPELLQVMYYEMLATHTLPRFQPTNPRIAGDEAINAGFFEFVEGAAPTFGNRVPLEDVGLYYSSSSIMRQLTPRGYVDHNAQPHQFGFWGWGTALGELHYQYRAVPEWKLTPETLATLRLLVIPNADVLGSEDVSLLQTWVGNGGRLVVTGDSGKYLPESGNFDPNPSGWSIAPLTNHANVVYLPANTGMDYYLAYGNRPSLLSGFSDAMDEALAGAPPAGVVETTASGRAGITLYEEEGLERFYIDVNNFDIDLGNSTVTGTGPVEIEAVLPEELRGRTLVASVVSPQSPALSVALPAPANSNQVRIALGSVEYYAGIVLVPEDVPPRSWSQSHFSEAEIAAGLAKSGQDPDGDGATNWQEYVAGTNPRDPASRFDLQISPNLGTSGMELAFGSATGRLYSLYASTDLVHGAWSPLQTNLSGSGSVLVVSDTNDWHRSYYRVEATFSAP